MSSYGDDRRRGYDHRDDRGDYDERDRSRRRRSVSPERGPRRERSHRRDEPPRNPRNSGGEEGGRGGRGGFRGRGGGSSSITYHSSLPDLPAKAEVPSTGRLLPLKGAQIQGKSGLKTIVKVNHFEIQSLPIVKIFEYSIVLKVPESSQRRGSDKVSSFQLARVLLNNTFAQFVGANFVFDGVSRGWSPKEFVSEGETKSTRIELEGHRPDKPNQIDVAIRNNGPLNIGLFVQYMRGQLIDLDPMGNLAIEPVLKWLNAIYRKDPASRFVTRPNTNAYFQRSPDTTMELTSTAGVLEAVRGMFQTVQLRFGRITLNVDTATTAFFVPGKALIELAHALTGVPPRDDIQQFYTQFPESFRDACLRLVGMFFVVKHLPNPARRDRKIRLTSLSLKGAMDTVFEVGASLEQPAKMISVNEYFLQKYSIKLRYPNLPLAVSKDGEFPLELCFSASGERFKEPLQGRETADFIKFATSPAFIREQQITENLKKLNWHNLDDPKAHGLSVHPQMMQVPARVLASPIPQYGAHTTDRRAPENGKWNLRGKQLFMPRSIRSCGLLYFPARGAIDDLTIENWLRTATNAFRALGINVPNGGVPWLKGNPQGNIAILVGELMQKVHNAFGGKPQLLLFLIHSGCDPLYKAIKNVSDMQFGVASQVMLVEKAIHNARGQLQYLANIGLKVNVKLGGVNSTVHIPLFQQQRYMLMGGDVSHPSPAQLRMNPPPPSFSALTGSWDRDCTAYTAVTSAQFAKEQLISDFDKMAEELLSRYREKNNETMPQSIIYYRDGLSESEFPQILASEGEPLKELCKKYGTKVTVVVCIKRHHTRLFPTEEGDELGNVIPGTVVENSPTHDFFLVAHSGLQGTVRPTRYVVLTDDNNFSADHLQLLTNSVCWTYARATRSVSIVPPVYYADQAAERAKLQMRTAADGTSFLGPVQEDLKFTMYWQ
ncbi:MAG: hypothetical protein M1812_006342 [Candelaria pacifica]|nr:MAG: hypothetical protein M1812_006342 [Candelaria pacifica]